MRRADDEIRRWRDTSQDRLGDRLDDTLGDPGALPARAADLMDAGRDVPVLAKEALARIERTVRARGTRRAAGGPLVLRLALLATIVLASAATARGALSLWHRYVAAPAPALAPGVPPAAPSARRRVGSRAEVAAPAAIIEPVRPAPFAGSVPRPPRPRHVALSGERAVHPVAGAEREPEVAASEAEVLASALSRLRQAGDPRGALVLLDQYARTFPRGVLASEALSARLEAVLAMGDHHGALEILDGRRAFSGRLGSEQLLTRAELRANAGRYADAIADFDRLLGSPAGLLPPASVERALYGRAVSLGHLGGAARARADLLAYQKAFPAGRHAAEVARLLAGTSAATRP